MGQCQGITKSGRRCRIKIANDNVHFCRYHKFQDPTIQKKELIEIKSNPGFIYVFTLVHLIDKSPSKQPWLRMAAPTSNNTIDYKRTREFKPKHYILLKIGYTTTTPRQRIKQWQNQCHHHYILVTPELIPKLVCSKTDKIGFLVQRFQQLRIGKRKKCKNFDDINAGFHTNRAYEVEQSIHATLRKKYGFSKIYCDGCKCSTGGIHKEWFLIPRQDVGELMHMINEMCV